MAAQPSRVESRGRRLAPTVALSAAGALLAVSLLFPYWNLTLVTPEHPRGLSLVSYLAQVEGPLDAVLECAGGPTAVRRQALTQLERSLVAATVTVICLLVVAATFVRNRWAALLSLPALCFPMIVIADTSRWLGSMAAGVSAAHGELPAAAPLWPFGVLAGGGVSLETRPGVGLLIALAASVTVLVGLWLHRDAYHGAGEMGALEGEPRRGWRIGNGAL